MTKPADGLPGADGDVPIIGENLKPKNPVWYQDLSDGTRLAYPVVMVHLVSDNALEQIADKVCEKVLEALDKRDAIISPFKDGVARAG